MVRRFSACNNGDYQSPPLGFLKVNYSLVMQKLPDLLVLTLLFVPANCPSLFRLQ
ncbi:DUF2593 family protein [Klebsiella pneumoniae]|nr:DUF2593 family protein [Klebsiella pneumoniae]